MVEQASVKNEDSNATLEKKASQGSKRIKKKSSRIEGVPELLMGVGFCLSQDSPDLYLKAIKRLGLYVFTTYKIGSDVQICLDTEELVLPEEHVIPVNSTLHKCKIWDLRAEAAVKMRRY